MARPMTKHPEQPPLGDTEQHLSAKLFLSSSSTDMAWHQKMFTIWCCCTLGLLHCNRSMQGLWILNKDQLTQIRVWKQKETPGSKLKATFPSSLTYQHLQHTCIYAKSPLTFSHCKASASLPVGLPQPPVFTLLMRHVHRPPGNTAASVQAEERLMDTFQAFPMTVLFEHKNLSQSSTKWSSKYRINGYQNKSG